MRAMASVSQTGDNIAIELLSCVTYADPVDYGEGRVTATVYRLDKKGDGFLFGNQTAFPADQIEFNPSLTAGFVR